MNNFKNAYCNAYVKTVANLELIKHGQEINVSQMKIAYQYALMYGTLFLRCLNDKGTISRVSVHSALKCLEGFGGVNKLIVCCDDNGFIFTLPKSEKRKNLLKCGYTEDEAAKLLIDDLETIYPIIK